MRLSLLIASSLVVLASAESEKLQQKRSLDANRDNDTIKEYSSSELADEWTNFKSKYVKSYANTTESKARKNIFARHLRAIEINNYLYRKGLKSFTMGLNEYADLDNAEFVRQMTGYIHRNLSDDSRGSTFLSPDNSSFTLPKEVDWRGKGYVTDVTTQGICGSSWAFSVTGALEGQTFRKTGKLVRLSAQQLVDCAKDFGCNGGNPRYAFDYVKSNGGLDTDRYYPSPFDSKDKQCRYHPSEGGATCSGYVEIEKDSEAKLQEAVASVGPISVAIDAGHVSFQLYKNGVYDEPDCSSTDLNHAVLVVGYGTSKSGDDYWIVKNSWGPEWGLEGYIQMSRNKNNQCGLATDSIYPLV